tara:strand:- start:12927 stop:13475 length:549 start_codon:yes stop_codon:yes gene_type:complete
MKYTRITDKDTLSTLLAIVKNNYGFDVSEVSSSSRKQIHVMCRQAMSNIARIEQNIHPEIIGARFNKDRTSILSYFNKHQTYYDNWKGYKQTFDTIYNDYCKLKNKRRVFETEQELRSYLFNVGVKYSDNPSIFIKVQMKDFTVIINTDYRNVSFNSELVRVALIDYDCIIEIDFENEKDTK